MLIAIDDLHWADADSLEMLSLLCRRIGSLPAAIIATMRAWPEDAREVASRLVDTGVAWRVRLAPLSREESTAMLVERAGREVSPAAAAKALELCAGVDRIAPHGGCHLLEQQRVAGAEIEGPGTSCTDLGFGDVLRVGHAARRRRSDVIRPAIDRTLAVVENEAR